MLRKLRSRRGESLVEVLCAVLVIALGSAMLAVMINAAVTTSTAANAKADEFFAALSESEKGESSAKHSGTVRVSIGGDSQDINVYYFGEDSGLVSYRKGA